jgi:hypothetical protein
VVALVTTDWELKGKASIISPEDCILELSFLKKLEVEWYVLVRVDPIQIRFLPKDGWGVTETIDLI